MAATKTVPVSDPSHPDHPTWLQIILGALLAASSIGPAVVAIVSPGNATEAAELGQVAAAATTAAQQAVA